MAYISKTDMKGNCNADTADAPGQPADTKFIAPGEDISTEIANRPHLQLAENCDILKVETDKLSNDKGVFVNEKFTLSSPSNTIDVDPTGGAGGDINFTGQILIGDTTDSSMSGAVYEMLWRVVDESLDEIILNNNIVRVIAASPGPTIGWYNSGIVTFTLNETLPAGTYRFVFVRDRALGSVQISDWLRDQHCHQGIWGEVKTRDAVLQAQIDSLLTMAKENAWRTAKLRAVNLYERVDILGAIASFQIKGYALKPASGDNNHIWVLVGDDTTAARYGRTVQTPRDIPWTGGTLGTNDRMNDVKYADSPSFDGFVAVGRISAASGAAVETSTNGSTWTAQTLTGTVAGDEAHTVVYDDVNDKWVVCGEITTTPAGWIKYAADPTGAWSTPTLPAGIESLVHMAYNGNGIIMACGKKTGTPDVPVVIRSTDGGVTWTEVLVAGTLDTEFQNIAYSAYHDRWAVSSGQDYHYYSDDPNGDSWTQGVRHYNTNTAMLFDETGLLVSYGGAGFIDVSTDLGATWQSLYWNREDGSSGPFFGGSDHPNSIAYIGGMWLLALDNVDHILISHVSEGWGNFYV